MITPKRKPVVNLVCDMSSHPDLQFYQVSSKYSKGYSSYRADKKFYADTNVDADANGIRSINNMSPPPPPLVMGGHNEIIQNTITDVRTWSFERKFDSIFYVPDMGLFHWQYYLNNRKYLNI